MNKLFALAVSIFLMSGQLVVFAAGGLTPPLITVSPEIYYPLDELLYIEGKAEPDSRILLQFQRQGSEPVQFGVNSNERGEWKLSRKIFLSRAKTVALLARDSLQAELGCPCHIFLGFLLLFLATSSQAICHNPCLQICSIFS